MRIIKTSATDHSTKDQFDTNLNGIMDIVNKIKQLNLTEDELNNMAWTVDKVATSFDDLQEVHKHFHDKKPYANLSDEELRRRLMWAENDNQYIEWREGVPDSYDMSDVDADIHAMYKELERRGKR